MSICFALLIVKVIFVTTLFYVCFFTFLVNKDDQICQSLVHATLQTIWAHSGSLKTAEKIC